MGETQRLSEGAKDFNYIKPTGRRLSEYEAVILHVQPNHKPWDGTETFVTRHDGRPAWDDDSTALQVEDWFSFRDPNQMWQRPYIVRQTDQEKTIERLVGHWAESGVLGAMKPDWATHALGELYLACSFFENGLFRTLIISSRETLSDSVSAVFMFNSTDKARHAQDIVLYHLELIEAGLPVRTDNGKELWLRDPRFQTLRRLTERLLACPDWAEAAVAINLVVEPLVARLIYQEILCAGAPSNGDLATPVILAEAAADRKRNLAWTKALVELALDEPGTAGHHNAEVIAGWITSWREDALAAMADLAPLAAYAGVEPEAAVQRVLHDWAGLIDPRIKQESP